jgi:hypothetical protein
MSRCRAFKQDRARKGCNASRACPVLACVLLGAAVESWQAANIGDAKERSKHLRLIVPSTSSRLATTGQCSRSTTGQCSRSTRGVDLRRGDFWLIQLGGVVPGFRSFDLHLMSWTLRGIIRLDHGKCASSLNCITNTEWLALVKWPEAERTEVVVDASKLRAVGSRLEQQQIAVRLRSEHRPPQLSRNTSLIDLANG